MKRKNNEGSVFYNSSRNKWNAQYKIEENGKIKIKTKSFKNKEDAEDFIDVIMYERNSNDYIKKHGVNLISFMKSRALAKLNSNTISKSQYIRICESIKRIKNSELSKIQIKNMKNAHIQAFLNSLIADYSDSSIKKIYGRGDNPVQIAIIVSITHFKVLFF